MFEDLRDIWAWACYWSNHKSWIWLFGTWVQILALLNQYRAGFNCFSQKVGFWHFLNESTKQHWDLSRLFPGRWSRHRYQLSAIYQGFNERVSHLDKLMNKLCIWTFILIIFYSILKKSFSNPTKGTTQGSTGKLSPKICGENLGSHIYIDAGEPIRSQ